MQKSNLVRTVRFVGTFSKKIGEPNDWNPWGHEKQTS